MCDAVHLALSGSMHSSQNKCGMKSALVREDTNVESESLHRRNIGRTSAALSLQRNFEDYRSHPTIQQLISKLIRSEDGSLSHHSAFHSIRRLWCPWTGMHRRNELWCRLAAHRHYGRYQTMTSRLKFAIDYLKATLSRT